MARHDPPPLGSLSCDDNESVEMPKRGEQVVAVAGRCPFVPSSLVYLLRDPLPSLIKTSESDETVRVKGDK